VPPHPRVHQNIQRDHPVDNILGDIEKGVTTRSRVTIFCEHYSVVSSFGMNFINARSLYLGAPVGCRYLALNLV
jgi:hypothetical protein